MPTLYTNVDNRNVMYNDRIIIIPFFFFIFYLFAFNAKQKNKKIGNAMEKIRHYNNANIIETTQQNKIKCLSILSYA